MFTAAMHECGDNLSETKDNGCFDSTRSIVSSPTVDGEVLMHHPIFITWEAEKNTFAVALDPFPENRAN